jgi:hypothetical protein
MHQKKNDASNRKYAEIAMAAPKGGVQMGLGVKEKHPAARGRKTLCRGRRKKRSWLCPASPAGGEAVKLKPKKKRPTRREGKRIYADDDIAALRLVWAFFRYKRGKIPTPSRR